MKVHLTEEIIGGRTAIKVTKRGTAIFGSEQFTIAHSALRTAIERLAEMGCLECGYRTRSLPLLLQMFR